jgi:hypothetical protein
VATATEKRPEVASEASKEKKEQHRQRFGKKKSGWIKTINHGNEATKR